MNESVTEIPDTFRHSSKMLLSDVVAIVLCLLSSSPIRCHNRWTAHILGGSLEVANLRELKDHLLEGMGPGLVYCLVPNATF